MTIPIASSSATCQHFMPEVTQILSQIEHGDPLAAERLLPLVDDELRKLANVKLAQEKPVQTLQATALVAVKRGLPFLPSYVNAH